MSCYDNLGFLRKDDHEAEGAAMSAIGGVLLFTDASRESVVPDVTRLEAALGRNGSGCGSTWYSRDERIGLTARAPSARSDVADSVGHADGISVVWEGTITNGSELHDKVVARDHGKASRSVSSLSAVLCQAYGLWGIDFVTHLRGQFAIALWDQRRASLFLIRDRIGAKQLYYRTDCGRFLFGSTADLVLAAAATHPSLNPIAIHDYLTFLAVPAPQTIYSGIFKLPPATILEFDSTKRIVQRSYWDVLDTLTNGGDFGTLDQAASELRVLLEEAVAINSPAGSKTGIFVSDGVDSNALVGLLSEGARSSSEGFTAAYDVGEDSHRGVLGRTRGLPRTTIVLEKASVLESVDEVIRLQDEPLGDPAGIWVHSLAAAAKRRHFSSVLLGEGADTVFGGLPSWGRVQDLQRFLDSPVGSLLVSPGLRLARVLRKEGGFHADYFRRARRGQPLFWTPVEYLMPAQKSALIAPQLRRELQGWNGWEAVHPHWQRFRELGFKSPGMVWMRYLCLKTWFPDLLLARTDKMMSSLGMEARFPFLDHEIVDFATRLPEDWQVRAGCPKYLFKRSVRDLVPSEVLAAPKVNSPMPVEWLDSLTVGKGGLALQRFCEETGWLDLSAAFDILKQGRLVSTWALLNFALWWTSHEG